MCTQDLDGHDAATLYGRTQGDWQFHTELHEGPVAGCLRYDIRVTVHVEFVDYIVTTARNSDGSRGAPTRVNCDHASSQDYSSFKTVFQREIYHYWNDKLWLTPERRSLEIPNLKCGVVLEYVENKYAAQMRVKALLNPDGPFGASCTATNAPNEHDIIIDFDDEKTFDTAGVHYGHELHQNVAAHEFGHYIFLDHACERPREDGTADNSDSAYCIDQGPLQFRDMMAVGNQINPWHALAWKWALPNHHYHCGVTWAARTSAP